MNKLKLLLLIFISINSLAQDLPEFINYPKKNEIARNLASISYYDNTYVLDHKIKFKSSTQIGERICEKYSKLSIREDYLAIGYVTLEIDKNASVLVLDSIHNELKALNIRMVVYRTGESINSGFLFKINSEEQAVRDFLVTNGMYVPVIRRLKDCQESEEDNG